MFRRYAGFKNKGNVKFISSFSLNSDILDDDDDDETVMLSDAL